MATPTPNPRSKRRPKKAKPETISPWKNASSRNDPPQVVDPVWLVKAMGITIVCALTCGYLTLCLLFYQGQWQLVLHPSRSDTTPASIGGSPFQTVHFGIDETATPQLTAWFVPAESKAHYAAYTVLYLPSGDGSLSSSIPALGTLHQLGINVFAFDYRGYGQSAPTRPNQRRMTEDAASAWQYLTVSRALKPSQIIVFGDALGSALAVQLAVAHPEIPAVVLQSPRPMVVESVLADPRTKWLPVRALFHEDFDVTHQLAVLKTPKLFLMNSDRPTSAANTEELHQLTSAAAAPKKISMLPFADLSGGQYRKQLTDFFDEYLR